MICPNCGKELPDNAKFCENCGTAISQSANETPVEPPQPTAPVNDGVFSSSAANTSQSTATSNGQTQDWGLKWHNALQVLLILGVLGNLVYAINFLTGSQYAASGVTAEEVYEVYGSGLKTLDTFYGLVCFALAILGGIIVYMLHGFKKMGPTLLLALYAVNFVTSIIYLSVGSSITGINLFDASSAGSLVGSVVMFVANKIYYDHRKHLFVN